MGKLKSQPRPLHVVHVRMKQQTIVPQDLEHRKQHCVCYWWWIRPSVYFSAAEDSRKTDVKQLAPVSMLCPERSMSYICCIIHSTLHSPSALDIMWSLLLRHSANDCFLCGTADVRLLYYELKTLTILPSTLHSFRQKVVSKSSTFWSHNQLGPVSAYCHLPS